MKANELRGGEAARAPGWGELPGTAGDAERCHGNGEWYPAPHGGEDAMGMGVRETAPSLPQTFKKHRLVPYFFLLF